MFKITQLAALFVFLFVFSGSYSQDRIIDSLKIAFQNPKVHDTTKMNTIIHMMKTHYTLNNSNYFYLNNWNGKLAKETLKKKNTTAVQKAATLSLSTYYNGLAIESFVKGQIDKSVPYIDKSIALCKSVKGYDEMYYQYIVKAQFLYRINETEKAVTYLFDALRFYEKDQKKNIGQIAYATSTIASIYAVQKNHKKAIVYFKKVLEYYDLDDTIEQKDYLKAIVYTHLGSSYQQLLQYPEAVENYNKALEISKNLGDTVNENQIYAKLGMIKLDQNKYEEAEKILKNLLSTKQDARSEAHINLALARLYLEKKEYEKGLPYAEKGYKLSTDNKYLDLQDPAADFLFQLSKETKDYKRALEMNELNVKLKDSSKIEASKNALAQQQLKYDFEKKELQQMVLQEKKLSLVKLEAERKNALQISKNKLAQQKLKYDFDKKALNQKIVQGKKIAAVKLEGEKKTAAKNNWLIGLSGVLLLVLLGGYFYYRNSRQKQAITVLEKNQIKQKLLITQMNPHFIFNSIQNIRGLINNNHNKEAVNYLEKFSRLTRQILENSNENYISLEEEVQMIDNYLTIQQLLYDNKFSFTIQLQEGIDTESIFLPPMLAQPFIENSIKHGLSNTTENGKINVHFYLKDEKLFFEVTDNGKGFDAEKKVSNHKSLAMTITKERLIGYTKNKEFDVQTNNLIKADGTIEGAKVVFEIPYIYEN